MASPNRTRTGPISHIGASPHLYTNVVKRIFFLCCLLVSIAKHYTINGPKVARKWSEG